MKHIRGSRRPYGIRFTSDRKEKWPTVTMNRIELRFAALTLVCRLMILRGY
jgi:hypothetical protein